MVKTIIMVVYVIISIVLAIVVLSQEAFEYSCVAGFSTHSSNAIAIVEARCDWIRILSSGPMKIFLPST